MSIKAVIALLMASALCVESKRHTEAITLASAEAAQDQAQEDLDSAEEEDQVQEDLASAEAEDQEQEDLDSAEEDDEELEYRSENFSFRLEDGCAKAACLEKKGQSGGLVFDRDCCARPTGGGCQSGYLFSYGDKCNINGAMTTCCRSIPHVEASGGCMKPACRENGKVDKDCCAKKGRGSCQDGFEFSTEGECHSNGALKTCCKQLPPTPKQYGKAPKVPEDSCVKPACMENGKPDHDCCAKAGQGSCQKGFMFSYGDNGEMCNKFSRAYRTCCKKLPEKNEVEGDNEKRACMENGRYDRDCCAKAGTGSCVAGYQFSYGDKCSLTGAYKVICKKYAF